MSLNARHLREQVIRPVLEGLDLWSQSAEELVLGTAAKESGLEHLRQLARSSGARGPALGLWQIEPATHVLVWRWIEKRPQYLVALEYAVGRELGTIDRVAGRYRLTSSLPDPDLLQDDLRYGCAICRLLYRSILSPLPPAGDIEGHAVYWDSHYNRNPHAGTPDEYVRAWKTIVLKDWPS